MKPRTQWRRTVLAGVAGAGVVLVLAAAVWAWIHVPALPDLPPTPPPGTDPAVAATREAARSQAIVTTRASVLAALAGLGALATIAINYRNSRTAAATLASTHQTFLIAVRGHLTDRYTKAIEQLGAQESLATRLGGIYGLQQFAVESDRDDDQSAVIEVLSAFVRSNLPRRTGEPVADDNPASEPIEPPPDVLAAISVLAQLPNRVTGPFVDFAGTDFTGQRLTQARLRAAHLPGVNLYGAVLRTADLTRADLSGADLREVDFTEAGLMKAALHHADLRRADLRGGIMARADLRRADLREAVLRGVLLGEADLRDADLRGAFFDGAQFAGADLRRADLRGVHFFHEADLADADLRGARLDPGQLTSTQRAAARHAPNDSVVDDSAT